MNGRLETRYRLLGVLPLTFFLVQTIHYWRFGGMGNLWWMCNAGNVLLGIGLLIGQRELIRAAAIWTIPGLVIWIKYVLLASGGFYFSTTQAHVGGIIVGMIALRRVGMDRIAWLYAFGWALLTQLAAWLFTAPDLNVNVAHHIQNGFETTFSSYWKFWVVLMGATAAVLWALGFVLSLIWPAKSVSEPRAAARIAAK
jgi:uncharacterized MnhB-related membrane protein